MKINEAIHILKENGYNVAQDDTERLERLARDYGCKVEDVNADIDTPEMDAIRERNQLEEVLRTAWGIAFSSLKKDFPSLENTTENAGNNHILYSMYDSDSKFLFGYRPNRHPIESGNYDTYPILDINRYNGITARGNRRLAEVPLTELGEKQSVKYVADELYDIISTVLDAGTVNELKKQGRIIKQFGK